ncbi:helix-turn-helix domain-containing protein [Chengkuizengella marina]|uniref:XRE family transcriptional regulator n=1 Tax=Chengkuizengella marina TaxID=2507566 RepID=A0A6N9Q214_9BACL|nr:helix-turn-helix transcriptional regulator [Chengkuizengella marina]NBI28344.1 XRE family transcriptional regulator [Chengkuizengella marina]
MVIWGKGLGRNRSKLGSWMDENKISQKELGEKTGINKSTISDLCREDEDRHPNRKTKDKIMEVINEVDPKATKKKFW